MDNIVGGANKVKALVSIWRPEFERYFPPLVSYVDDIDLVDILCMHLNMFSIISIFWKV